MGKAFLAVFLCSSLGLAACSAKKGLLETLRERNGTAAPVSESRPLTPEEQADYTDHMAAFQRHWEHVFVTTGPLSQPYEALGEVHINTLGMLNFGSLLNDALFRSPLAVAAGGRTAVANEEQMNAFLREQASRQYGARVDAIINASYRADHDGNVFASGLAVRFLDPQPAPTPVAASPTLEQKLVELKSLREKNLITPDEYYDKRSELLKGL